MATTVKEHMLEIIREQPEDSSYDEILRELAFARMTAKIGQAAFARMLERKE